jgi:hypothetical protein
MIGAVELTRRVQQADQQLDSTEALALLWLVQDLETLLDDVVGEPGRHVAWRGVQRADQRLERLERGLLD